MPTIFDPVFFVCVCVCVCVLALLLGWCSGLGGRGGGVVDLRREGRGRAGVVVWGVYVCGG